jgi:hypothetical protein
MSDDASDDDDDGDGDGDGDGDDGDGDDAPHVFAIVDTPTALDTEGKPFTAYVISFAGGDSLPRTAVRRYSQFAVLHKALCSFFPKQLVPRLTSKRFLNNRSADTVERRRVKLVRYLNELAAKPSLLFSEAVETFLYNTRDIELSGSSNSIRHNERHADSSPNATLVPAASPARRPAPAAGAARPAAESADKNQLMQRKMNEILELQQKVSLEQQARTTSRRGTDNAPPSSSGGGAVAVVVVVVAVVVVVVVVVAVAGGAVQFGERSAAVAAARDRRRAGARREQQPQDGVADRQRRRSGRRSRQAAGQQRGAGGRGGGGRNGEAQRARGGGARARWWRRRARRWRATPIRPLCARRCCSGGTRRLPTTLRR